MTEHPTPAETRRILLGITNPAEDVERRAVDAGILRRNWRTIAATKEEPAEPQHDPGCDEWCNHCEACGVGILYGSRCHDHPNVPHKGQP